MLSTHYYRCINLFYMNINSRKMMAGLLTSAIGLATLIGWLFDIEPLKRIRPGLPVMYPDAALAFVLAGLSLCGSHAGYPRPARAGAYAVLLLAVLPIAVDAAGGGFYLSLWQWAGAQAGGADFAGHMSALSSTVFVLAGLGLMALGKGRAFPPAQLAALIMLIVAAFALLGYAYDMPSFHTSPPAKNMAVPTAFATAALAIGLLFAEPGRGFAAAILSEWSGGILLRRLLPYIIAVPALIGWLRLRGEYAGLYDMNTGLVLFALSNIILLIILLYRSARLLNRKDLLLHENERRAGEIIDHTLDGIVTANDRGIIESFNAAASQMFGYAPKDVIGKNVSLLMPESYRNEHEGYIEDYLRTGSGRILRQGGAQGISRPAARWESIFDRNRAQRDIFTRW